MRLCMCLWVLAFCILASDLGALADVSSLISKDLFEQILKHRNDAACQAKGFYTYEAFVNAANSFGAFATTGDTNTRKREIAAFLAQTSHETTGGWATAPDGPYAWGYCFKQEQGNPPDYCVANQQWPSFCILASDLGALADVSSLISKDLFEQILKHRNDAACEGKGFYTYEAFVNAANSFGAFATTGDTNTRKREIAAFLAQTSHETTDWPCPPGKQYYGRGPIQLTHNYNYGQAGRGIRADLINNPDLVATDTVISFKTAIWFWMTPQANKPSSHNVITGRWTPSDADRSANRIPGYGVITNIINGGLECGHGNDNRVASRIGFYRRYCDIFGVSYGNNLDCYNQRPFA
ncbi:hypothetical protein Pint_28628 [Pistacia integerrima]|uniref:Uncharacterized protein n=1 Tax=Pistacia integerrima TaxID=434235 RepID=A0ACC0YNA1_9ROSI|nr:hypothetical protein Pint_28628 [Pistacia integerrima]